MTDEEILSAVEELARRHVGWQGRLAPGQRLVEDLGLDSVKQLTLVVEVENRFRVRLPADLGEIATVADLVRALRGAGAG